MDNQSRIIESNQSGPHERLEETVRKHLTSEFRKPIADHTRRAFDAVAERLQAVDRPLILDSCCGVGESSRMLASKYSDHWVIGVDKSENRLTKEQAEPDPENLILARADLNDFFRLVDQASWTIERHYILYPNPWPKSVHLGRRWHGAPVFPAIVSIGGLLELRSNWKLYLEEFQIALRIAGKESELTAYEPERYITPFERKYHQSHQQLWQLSSSL